MTTGTSACFRRTAAATPRGSRLRAPWDEMTESVLSWYHDNMMMGDAVDVTKAGAVPDRTQTGLRMDRNLLKVLKGLAEYLNLSLADLVEGILLHALEAKPAITDDETLLAVERLRQVYGLSLTAADSHQHPDID